MAFLLVYLTAAWVTGVVASYMIGRLQKPSYVPPFTKADALLAAGLWPVFWILVVLYATYWAFYKKPMSIAFHRGKKARRDRT